MACTSMWYGDTLDEREACPVCLHEHESPLGETRDLLRKGEDVEP